jgi:pentatricopeptide repeat protein
MNIVNDVVKMAESRNFKFMDEIYLGVMRSLPDVKYVEEFVHSVKKRNRYVPSNVWMEVITMQAQRGFYNASLFTWKEMMEYGVEITKKRCEQMIGLAQYVKRSEARFTFQRMRELVFEPMKKLPDDQKPDAHTYNMMIKAALLMKRPAKALELWDEIDALKLPLNTEEKMITRKEVEEISELKQTFEKDKKNSMESLNPLTRGVNFERTDVVVIAELIRHYLKEYSDSRSVAAWDSLPPKNLDRYFTLTERQIIQQKGIDLNSLPTVFDRKAPVIQFSSQKQEVVEEVPKEETPKTGESFSQVFNQDDFDEVWMLDDNKNEEENESKETASEVKPQEPQQSNEEIIAKNSEITPQSRNFKGVAFSPAGSWRSFFFVYNRLVGEGFGYTLAQAKEDMRIKMLDPNSKFFTYIKERITEEEFKHLLKVYSASRKYNKYSVFWKKIQRTPEERQANREHRTKLEKESQKAKEERKKEALEKQRLKKDKEADPTQLIK